MDWKEFLKPDLRKLLLFAVLFGVLFIIPIEYKVGPRICDCVSPPCECSEARETIAKTSPGNEIMSFFVYNPYLPYDIIITALIGFIPLLGLYILSGILISGYDKFKTKTNCNR